MNAGTEEKIDLRLLEENNSSPRISEGSSGTKLEQISSALRKIEFSAIQKIQSI
jgi:hypothetical protein